jgi:hypothetical protein
MTEIVLDIGEHVRQRVVLSYARPSAGNRVCPARFSFAADRAASRMDLLRAFRIGTTLPICFFAGDEL